MGKSHDNGEKKHIATLSEIAGLNKPTITGFEHLGNPEVGAAIKSQKPMEHALGAKSNNKSRFSAGDAFQKQSNKIIQTAPKSTLKKTNSMRSK